MSLTGSLDDVSVADVMQFIHLGGRSGTLTLAVGTRRAEIGFHRGRIISARGPEHLPLGEWLVHRNAVRKSDVDAALAAQARATRPLAIGKLLVDMGVIDLARLKELVEEQIEKTVYSLVAWTGGTFSFSVDELKPVDDLAMAPGDILPDIHINTQMVLLEAARILDERNRQQSDEVARSMRPAPSAVGSAPQQRFTVPDELGSSLSPLTQIASRAIAELETRVQVVSADAQLCAQLEHTLHGTDVTLVRASARDAGTRLLGEGGPVVLVDLPSGVEPQVLATLRRTRPRALLIAIAEDLTSRLAAYEHGAVSVVPRDPHVIARCVINMLDVALASLAAGERSSARTPTVTKLTRAFGEMRSGLLTATVSLNLMNLVSESVERAVLFVAAPTRLLVLGAYGHAERGQPLAEHTRSYQMPLEAGGALTDSLRDGRSRSMAYEGAELPDSFTALIGRPASGACAIFPLLGSRKVIATMYVDNGHRHMPIDDVEFLEIATAQVGMFYENELLRRQLAHQTQSGRNKISLP